MPWVVRESFKHCGTQYCLYVPPDEAIFTDIIGYMDGYALDYWSCIWWPLLETLCLEFPLKPHILILDRDIPVCINIESGLLFLTEQAERLS